MLRFVLSQPFVPLVSVACAGSLMMVGCGAKSTSNAVDQGVAGSAGVSGAGGGVGGSSGAGGGASGAAGSEAYAPDWQTFVTHGECELQELANPEGARLFGWRACPGEAQCEYADVGMGNLLSTGKMLVQTTRAYESGGRVVLELKPSGDRTYFAFARDDGSLYQAYGSRYQTNQESCFPSRGASVGDQLVVSFNHRQTGDTLYIYHYAKASLTTGKPEAFGQDPWPLIFPTGAPTGPGTPVMRLTPTHVLLTHTGEKSIVSMGLGEPPAPKLIAQSADKPPGGIEVGSFGESAWLTAYTLSGAQEPETWLALTEGDQITSIPLKSTPQREVGSLRYANKHMGWLQWKPPSTPGAPATDIELWASPTSTNADGLSPWKIADIASSGSAKSDPSRYVAGYSHYATGSGSKIRVWNLANSALTTFAAPEDCPITALKGITRKYVWAYCSLAQKENNVLVRYPLTDPAAD